MKILSSLIFLLLFVIQLMILTSTGDVSNALHNLYCDLGLKNDYSCPIDGSWTSWSPWGACTGKCGFKGKRMRRRTCKNPPPSNNGAPCIGPNYQIESCQIIGCAMNDYEKVVNTHPVRRGELKIVKEIHKSIPALIELCFLVDCTFSIVEKILGNNAMAYWNAMNCVKYDVGCPSKQTNRIRMERFRNLCRQSNTVPGPGGWSAWGAWSTCSAICGRAKKYRTRVCNSPVPSNSKLKCDNSALEMKSCVGVNCKKHLNGTWSNWSTWSTCSVDCGTGIQIRKRSCSEIQSMQGTSCKGSSQEIKSCAISSCSINGMWSVWTMWTPCTSSCGIGTQLRNRMCSNPSPSGNGSSCFGSASEVRQCFTKPCIVKSHEVAHFTEKSTLLYNAIGEPSRLLHMYIRFLPLSPFGVIIHRFEHHCKGSACDFVKLFLQNGKIVLLSQINGCSLGLIYESKLEIGQWHVALTAIYGTHALLRIDDGPHKANTFSCIPASYNLDYPMKIGDGFQGEIQEVAINFDKYDQKYTNAPYADNNVEYLMGEDNEGFIYIGITNSVLVPCPRNMEYWHITIALKPDDINGIVAVIPDDSLNKYILLLLEEGRIKLKFHQGATYVAIESTEHILVGEWFEVVIVQGGKNMYMQVNGNEKKYVPLYLETVAITSATDIYLGAIQDEMKEKIYSTTGQIPQMSFTLGYLNIGGNKIDLLSLSIFETTSKRFSSRTISISDYYEEVPLFLGQEIKLSCFYDTIPYEKGHRYSKTNVAWLLMDQLLESYGKSDFYNIKDDGRVSTINIASYTTRDSVENFYSCHIYLYRNKSVKTSGPAHFTFGITIIDKSEEFKSALWKQWSFICGSIIVCFVILIIWCLLEILQDVKNGYGFYRLSQISNEDPTSTINFVLSKSGITLLGSQQAANDIVTRILKDN